MKIIGGGIFGKEWNYVDLGEEIQGFYKNIALPRTIVVDNEEFKRVGKLGEGAFGVVYEYKNKNKKSGNSIALKVGEISDDLNLVHKLKGSDCNQGMIPYQSVNSNMLLIMEKFDGDLHKLKKKEAYIHGRSIIYSIANVLKCLVSKGIYYTDLKAGNILFKREKGKIFAVLGDLGGAYIDKHGDTTATYPPIDRGDGGGFFKNPTEKDLVWMLGILTLNLLKYNTNNYSYNYISTIKKHEESLYLWMKKNPLYADILYYTLQSDPDYRMTLSGLMRMLEKGNPSHHVIDDVILKQLGIIEDKKERMKRYPPKPKTPKPRKPKKSTRRKTKSNTKVRKTRKKNQTIKMN